MNSKLMLLLPIIAGICWGTSGIFVRVLDTAGFDNLTIIFSKTIIAVPVVLVVILLYNRTLLKVKIKDLPSLCGVGISGVLLLSLTYNASVLHLTLSLASILLCLAPVFVLIFSAIIFGEKITRKKVLCMIAAIIGCAMLSGIFEGSSALKWSSVGLILGLGSAVINAMYTMISKVATDKGYHALTIYFYSFLFITIVLLPFADWTVMGTFLIASPIKSSAFYLAHMVFTSILPGIVYTVAVKHVEAGRVAILASGAEPTSAMLFGILMYSEIPSLIGVVGMIITIIALVILIQQKENTITDKKGDQNENQNI